MRFHHKTHCFFKQPIQCPPKSPAIHNTLFGKQRNDDVNGIWDDEEEGSKKPVLSKEKQEKRYAARLDAISKNLKKLKANLEKETAACDTLKQALKENAPSLT